MADCAPGDVGVKGVSVGDANQSTQRGAQRLGPPRRRAVKAIPICTLMHVAIARGTVDEIITPKFDCDYAVNDLI
jgi:hypothetical protein